MHVGLFLLQMQSVLFPQQMLGEQHSIYLACHLHLHEVLLQTPSSGVP